MTTDDIEFMVQLFLLLALQRNPTGEGLNVDAIVQGTREATLEQARGKLKDSTTYVIEFDGQRVAGCESYGPTSRLRWPASRCCQPTKVAASVQP
jgi:hypothetical protein